MGSEDKAGMWAEFNQQKQAFFRRAGPIDSRNMKPLLCIGCGFSFHSTNQLVY